MMADKFLMETERTRPAVDLSPEMPKAGDRIRLSIWLPSACEDHPGELTIILQKPDCEDPIEKKVIALPLHGPAFSPVTEFLDLPEALDPGFYVLTVEERHVTEDGPEPRQLIHQAIIVTDSELDELFEFASEGLRQATLAHEAIEKIELPAAVDHLKKAVEAYEKCGSFHCAGLNLLDAARVSRRLNPDSNEFVDLNWQAIQNLLQAGDVKNAGVALAAINETMPLGDTVTAFVDLGKEFLEEPVGNTELKERERNVLEVADIGLPSPKGTTLKTVQADFRKRLAECPGDNLYPIEEDTMVVLAKSQIEVYTGRVFLKGPKSPKSVAVLHAAKFFDALDKMGRRIWRQAEFPTGSRRRSRRPI